MMRMLATITSPVWVPIACAWSLIQDIRQDLAIDREIERECAVRTKAFNDSSSDNKFNVRNPR
jgi:hypothetical protein